MTTLREIVSQPEEMVDLFESRKKDAKILLGGKEHEFGSDVHLADMKRTLEGLQRLRDCYEKGSGVRLIIASACQKINKLIQSLADQKQTPVSPVTS